MLQLQFLLKLKIYSRLCKERYWGIITIIDLHERKLVLPLCLISLLILKGIMKLQYQFVFIAKSVHNFIFRRVPLPGWGWSQRLGWAGTDSNSDCHWLHPFLASCHWLHLCPAASTDSTSTGQQGRTLYLVDEEEMEHCKKRKLELQLLEEKIEAQKAIKKSMQKLAEMWE